MAPRAGFTISYRGDQGSIPPWSFEASSATSWVGRLGQARAAMLADAQTLHEQFETVRMAQAKRQTPLVKEPEARIRDARTRQNKLAKIYHAIAAIDSEVFDRELELREKLLEKTTHDPSKPSDEELRAFLRTATPEKRNALMNTYDFRMATLRAPAVLTGLDETMHKLLTDESLKAKFPADMQDLAAAKAAVEAARETHGVVTRANSNEILDAGGSVAEPAEPAKPPAWV